MPLRCTISQETDEIKLYNAILDITLFTNQARECVDPDVTLRSSFPLTLHSESPLGSSFRGGGIHFCIFHVQFLLKYVL